MKLTTTPSLHSAHSDQLHSQMPRQLLVFQTFDLVAQCRVWLTLWARFGLPLHPWGQRSAPPTPQRGGVCLEGKGNGSEPLPRVSTEDPMAEGPSLPPFLPHIPKPRRSHRPSVYRQLLGDVASAWDEMWRNESGHCDVGSRTGMLGFP